MSLIRALIAMFQQFKRRLFYGWVIVVAVLIVTSTLIGTRFSFGVFFKFFASEFDITRAATSSIFSVHMVFVAFSAVFIGWALDRYGLKLIVSFMGIFAGLSLLITSQVTSLWQMYLSYSLLLALGVGGFMPLIMTVVPRWFNKKRGLALGITTSGLGMGPMIMAPFAAYLVTNMGWRISYIIIGVITLIVILSATRLLRKEPNEIGTFPDGIEPEAKSGGSLNGMATPDLNNLSYLQTLKRKKFWFMFTMWLLWATNANLITTHIIPYATDAGISNIEASTIVSIMGGVQILSRLLFGRISDVIGRRIPAVICALLGAGAILWLLWSHDLPMFYLFAIVFGLGWGGLGVNLVTLSSEIFTSPNLGAIFGTLEMGYALGAAAGPLIGGAIFDMTGNYAIAFMVGANTMLIIAFLVIVTRR